MEFVSCFLTSLLRVRLERKFSSSAYERSKANITGSNFTNANHAIFLSPLLTETEYEYRSSETQAIGRVRRYGQTKTVHIWRFMSEDTMDIETYEKRTGEKRNSDSFKNKIYKL
jgi:hypothetical protein